MVEGALRKKLDGARVARPPIADIARLADLFARLVEENFRKILRVRPDIRVDVAEPSRSFTAFADIGEEGLIVLSELGGTLAGAAVLSPRISFRLIEMLTGITSAPLAGDAATEEGTRTLTAIDIALLSEPASAIFEAFLDAMPVNVPLPVRHAFTAPRMSSEGVSALGEDDLDGLFIRLSVSFSGEEPALDVPVFVPLATLDRLDGPALPTPRAKKAEPSIWSKTMLAAAKGAPFRMVGVLHEKRMSIGDIKDMKVGAVIPLPPDHHMQIDLRIDTPMGASHEPTVGGGVLGVVDGQRAVRLTAPPDPAFLEHLAVLKP